MCEEGKVSIASSGSILESSSVMTFLAFLGFNGLTNCITILTLGCKTKTCLLTSVACLPDLILASVQIQPKSSQLLFNLVAQLFCTLQVGGA